MAKNFAGKSKRGCVVQLRVPGERRALPLLTITRYYGELEVLLPRDRRGWLRVHAFC